MKNLISLSLISMLILGCSNAKTPTEVSAAFVPSGYLKNLSCSELKSERRRSKRDLENMEADLQKSYKDDKAAEVVAWVLFAPALLLMDGNTVEQKKFGEAKGTLLAVEDVMDTKGC